MKIFAKLIKIKLKGYLFFSPFLKYIFISLKITCNSVTLI